MPVGVRVLQVLEDTDRTPTHVDALQLHTWLTDAGIEVRTVALAPGRTGGLAATVPAIAPGRRTLAALTQLRAEARWADVVLLRGGAAAPPGFTRVRSWPPVILCPAPGEEVPGKLASRVRVVDAAAESGDEDPGEIVTRWVHLLRSVS